MSKQRNTTPRVISITGGKGGIGKTTVTVNLAIALAKENYRVGIFDADLGLANVNVLLGLSINKNISHVLQGECSIKDICVEGPCGITVIPAASGIKQLAEVDSGNAMRIISAFSELVNDFDILLIDTAAGISNQVVSFNAASDEVIVVICDEPGSIGDAYALIKLLSQHYGVKRFKVLSNMVRATDDGIKAFCKLCNMTDRFLNVTMQYLDEIPYDEYLKTAIQCSEPVVVKFPFVRSSQAFNKISKKITQWTQTSEMSGNVQFFVEKLVRPNHLQWGTK